MSTAVQEPNDPSATVAFFTDSRTLSQKLLADDREWRPHQPEHNCPKMIFGLVLERGTYVSDYGDKPAPTARILTVDNVVWSVIGFHGYLRSEFERKQPAVGDFVALAYLGTKPARKAGDSEAHVYRMEVERNPAAAAPASLEAQDESTASDVQAEADKPSSEPELGDGGTCTPDIPF